MFAFRHFSNLVPFKLQEGEVRIISLEQCQSYFDMKTITTRMVCAGYESGTVDSCMVSCFQIIQEMWISNNFSGPLSTH
jgi:corin